ncbi:UvrD-helicase domain-containing protein [Coraliomargarita sp. W4R72]
MSEAIQTLNPDDVMLQCLNLDSPKSFFLFAGAGSGKTRSLVEVLKKFKKTYAPRLRLAGQQVAIITYTNAACDEIQRRLDYDPTFAVSTIHSFAWSLIQPYTQDIRMAIQQILVADISDLHEKQAKGRAGQAALDRERKIESKTKRLENLISVRKFTYSPSGDNIGRDSLNHTEVIQLAAEFLMHKPMMQRILIQAYPILLIDESQDTNKALINTFFEVQQQHSAEFSLGLFGDAMQRIYMDGEPSLGQNIPSEWEKPVKSMNYRCPKRVTKLINRIREQADNQQQTAWDQNEEGFVRLFIVPNTEEIDKNRIEQDVRTQMATIAYDTGWNDDQSEVKTLCLEHKMAARRGGFFDFFNQLATVKSFYTGLLDGKLRGIPLFTEQIIPLITAHQAGDKFEVARIVRKHSPLLSKESLLTNSTEQITNARDAVAALSHLWNDNAPTLIEIIKEIHRSGLFSLTDELNIIASRSTTKADNDTEEEQDNKTLAWQAALQSDYTQVEAYAAYISDTSGFGTHQGVKGLEFPRVIVILDDAEAGGYSWSYEKLFGAKPATTSDIKNKKDGKETSIDKTRRLFYVTCSRAEKSLAVIAYTQNPQQVRQSAIDFGWFSENEVIDMQIE